MHDTLKKKKINTWLGFCNPSKSNVKYEMKGLKAYVRTKMNSHYNKDRSVFIWEREREQGYNVVVVSCLFSIVNNPLVGFTSHSYVNPQREPQQTRHATNEEGLC